jgi:chorismate synthase
MRTAIVRIFFRAIILKPFLKSLQKPGWNTISGFFLFFLWYTGKQIFTARRRERRGKAMAGSTIGRILQLTTWGESHGPALGAVLDGFPAGMEISEEMIQVYLDRRKPGQSAITTARREADRVQILSGVFEGRTTGTPISMIIHNGDQRSKDYGDLKDCFRPGHADYTFFRKYGLRDYRGGGRSSARETAARVAAGAIAAGFLSQMGIQVQAYTRAIGPVEISEARFDPALILTLPTAMPDAEANEKALAYMKECMAAGDSSGGVIECRITGMPAGIGDPVFNKLDAALAAAVMSIGAVKAVEIGDGVRAARARGSENNDAFCLDAEGRTVKKTNHAGGILGGISDGSDVILRAHIKPTPSISREQETVDEDGRPRKLFIKGRHDPVVVPRAVVVVECMAALTILDAMLVNMTARAENVLAFYS